MERNRFFVFVPSHRKIDGHVRYRLEARAAVQLTGGNTLLNHECEKRLSECRVFKDRVEEIMGNRPYNASIKTAFPGTGFMGTSARLEKWFNEVVNQLDTSHNTELHTVINDFLCMRESNRAAQSGAPIESSVPIVTAVPINAESSAPTATSVLIAASPLPSSSSLPTLNAVPVVSSASASWSHPSSSAPVPIPATPQTSKTGPRRFNPTKFFRRMADKSEADVSPDIRYKTTISRSFCQLFFCVSIY
jgi:hypothetical protein